MTSEKRCLGLRLFLLYCACMEAVSAPSCILLMATGAVWLKQGQGEEGEEKEERSWRLKSTGEGSVREPHGPITGRHSWQWVEGIRCGAQGWCWDGLWEVRHLIEELLIVDRHTHTQTVYLWLWEKSGPTSRDTLTGAWRGFKPIEQTRSLFVSLWGKGKVLQTCSQALRYPNRRKGKGG